MRFPVGEYQWEIARSGATAAIENAAIAERQIVAARRTADGLTRHEVEAELDPDGNVIALALRYSSSLFRRDAFYRIDGDLLRGHVSALAGRDQLLTKLGRFREIQAVNLIVFRMLILAHVRARGQTRWTGRVAVIDAASLAAAALKQTCRESTKFRWIYEARMGDQEELELDHRGVILTTRDNWGLVARLTASPGADLG